MRRPLLTFLLFAVSAAPAAAQDGVHLDPDSPTAKEYAVPLDAARRGASSGSTAQTPSGSAQTETAPLFGEGIAPVKKPASGKSGGGSGAKAKSPTASTNPPAAVSEIVSAAATRPGTPDGGGAGALLPVAGGALLLLALGGAGGLALRRRNSS
jgi:hypothetical protein